MDGLSGNISGRLTAIIGLKKSVNRKGRKERKGFQSAVLLSA